MKHGLVIGKFYPPHAGHALLVRTASALCERVTVVVMASNVEDLSLTQRVSWLREIHAQDANVTVAGIANDLPINFRDDAIWRAHIALMLEAARGVTDLPIDCAFSSEPYGAELAERLGARHVAVDPARTLVPISAGALREDPSAGWEFLAPCVRQDLARRVVLVGAESTGKTTLATHLAQHLRRRSEALSNTQCVPEYGREYTLYKLTRARGRAQLLGHPEPGMDELRWLGEDFLSIAVEQNRLEDRAARCGGSVLICDTDAFATAIWHERYCGGASNAVAALARPPERRLYLLTHDADVPFAHDAIRDGEQIRSWMTETFAARLTSAEYTWEWLRGDSISARAERALAMIDDWLSLGLQLSPPLAAER